MFNRFFILLMHIKIFIPFDLGISLLRILCKETRYTWREMFRDVYPGIPPSSSKLHIPNGELNDFWQVSFVEIIF